MKLLILSMVAFLLAILGMSIGVLLGRPALRGSCSGPPCELCDRGRDGACARRGSGEPTR